jgi:hypothetical protein
MTTRVIQKESSRARNDARELLEFIFVSELLAPSACLWVVSPWLRDIPVLDNRAGGYATLLPDAPRAEVRLSRVLMELVNRGTFLVVVTRPPPDGADIGEAVARETGSSGVRVIRRRDLHSKGIVGDALAFTGSMNLTNNGIHELTETLRLEAASAEVAQLRVQFRREYGGRDGP